MYLFYIIYVVSSEMAISPFNCHSLHLSEIYLTNEQKMKYSRHQSSKTYIVQESHINNQDNITITNLTNESNDCDNNNSENFSGNFGESYNISFKQRYFVGKKGFFYETNDCMCLTIAHENFENQEFSVKLSKCTYNDDQRFQSTMNNSSNSSSSSNQYKINVQQTNANEFGNFGQCKSEVNQSKHSNNMLFHFMYSNSMQKSRSENSFSSRRIRTN